MKDAWERRAWVEQRVQGGGRSQGTRGAGEHRTREKGKGQVLQKELDTQL